MSKTLQEAKQKEELMRKMQSIETSIQVILKRIQSALNQGTNPGIKNDETMKIYNDIYNFEDAFRNNFEANQQIDERFVDMYRKFLLHYVEEIKLEFDEFRNDPVSGLQIFDKHFQHYKLNVRWLTTIFGKLDTQYLKNKKKSLASIALQIFQEQYFEKYSDFIKMIMFHHFNLFRSQGTVIPDQIKRIIGIYETVGFLVDIKKDPITTELYFGKQVSDIYTSKYYQVNFQTPYLREIEIFYTQKIKDWSSLSTPEIISHIQKAFENEDQIRREFVPQSKKEITNTLHCILILNNFREYFNKPDSGVLAMLQYERYDQLHQLYKLLSLVKESLQSIGVVFVQFLEGLGKTVNETENERREIQQQGDQNQRPINIPELYIERLLALMDKADMIVEKTFCLDLELQKSCKQAFSNIVNKNEKSPLFLAIYSDMFFKNDKLSDEQIPIKINQIVKIFNYIYQRDVFIKHYQKMLSVRLLGVQYKNRDNEKQLLQKFKSEAGFSATSHLQTMLSDIEISETFNRQINQQLQEKFKCEFAGVMLSQGSWPVQQSEEVPNLPSHLNVLLVEFENHYVNQFKERIISWVLQHGTGEVNFRAKDKYLITLSTHQIIAFYRFNFCESQSVSELLRTTNLKKADLENALIPLVVFKIIKRQKKDLDEFDDHEILDLQLDFNNRQKRLRILPNPRMAPKRAQQQIELSKEEKEMQEQLQKEREYVIDSVIVKYMKSRKEMKHNDLVDETIKSVTSFRPNPIMVKKRIESLIEREYLKRDEVDWNTYTYIS